MFRMPTECVRRFTLFCEVGRGSNLGLGGWSMTFQKAMKTITNGLTRVGPVGMLGVDVRNSPTRLLEIISDD